MFTGYLAALAGCIELSHQGVIGVCVMMWIRWTLPRLRIDQVITDLPEVLHADRRRHVPRRDAVASLVPAPIQAGNTFFGTDRVGTRRDGQSKLYRQTLARTAPTQYADSAADSPALVGPRPFQHPRRALAMENGIYWPSFFFLLFSGVAVVFALAVVFSGNIVRMAFYLVLSLAATAGLFFLAGADFVGAMQLMIYVGGTLVLLIFGVMLTSQQRFVSMKTRAGDWILAAIVGGSLLALLVRCRLQQSAVAGESTDETAEAIEQASQRRRPSAWASWAFVSMQLSQPDDPLRSGMSGYLLIFEIVSVHLLGGARRRRVPGPCQTTPRDRRMGMTSADVEIGTEFDLNCHSAIGVASCASTA